MKKIKNHVFLIILLSFVFGCKTYSDNDYEGFDKQIQDYIKKQPEQFIRSESGLYYYIENEGEGKDYIKFTDKVTFAYTGKLLNGKLFDKKTPDNPVTLETRVLIEGWKEAFSYIKKGGKMKLVIPPQLGYADKELSHIPKNSVLVFDVEVVDVE